MLTLIKWDFINYIKIRYRLFVGFAMIIFITSIIQVKTRFVSTAIDSIGMITVTAFFLYSWFSALKELTVWLGRNSIQLELTQGSRPCLQLLSKLIRSMLIAGIGTVLTVYIMKYIVKYNGFIQTAGYDMEKILKVFLGMMTFFIMIIFSYLFSNMFCFLRKRLGVTSILIAVMFYLILGFLVIVFYGITGAWDIRISKDSTEIILATNSTHRSLETICYYAGSVIICVLGFYGSCFLLEHKFEPYHSKGEPQ